MKNVIILNKNQKHLKKAFESGGFEVVENKPMQKSTISEYARGYQLGYLKGQQDKEKELTDSALAKHNPD